jgi:hypothetical protein
VRFRIRHGNAGFSAVASPIVAEDTRVGVVILMVEAATSDERFLSLYRQIAEPLDALVKILHDIMGQVEAQRIRSVIADGVKAIGQLRRWSDANYGVLAGVRASSSRSNFDPSEVVREVSHDLEMEFAEREVTLGVQAPSGLPPIAGEAACLHEALMLLLQSRLGTAPQGGTVAVAGGRRPGRGVPRCVGARPRSGRHDPYQYRPDHRANHGDPAGLGVTPVRPGAQR